MKIIREFAIILSICFIGELINRYFIKIIPGTIIGMIILLILLSFGVLKLKRIESLSDFLLKHLSFFFLPGLVGLITSFDKISDKILPILTIIVISSVVVMVTTGLTVQFLMKVMKNDRVN